MDDQLIGPVAKMHMGKLHIPPHLFRLYGRACLRHLFLLIQEFKHTLCRGSRGLECVGDIGNLCDGLGKGAHVLDEGLDIADINHLFNGQIPAQQTYGYVTQVADK